MGWGTRRWQDDEDVFTIAQQAVQGTSDADAADALDSALAWLASLQGGDD